MNMPKYNWFYHTEPEPHLNGRRMHTPRGKVLGGSSSINGLVYIRGNPHGFRALGARGRARLVLPRRAAVFQTRRDAGKRAAIDTAAAPGNCAPATAARPIRCMRPGWRPASRRAIRSTRGRQRLSAGRLRPHGHDGGRGQALQRRPRVPEARDAPAEPQGADARARDPRAVRGRRATRRRIHARGRDSSRARRAGSHPLRRPHQLPAAAEALRCRTGRGACARSASAWSTICRAWARTCRITWSSISRSPARSRSRSIPRSIGAAAR